MKVEEIISYISDKELDFLALETSVDVQVKKLHGAKVFKIILYSMLNSTRISLRVMESMISSSRFKFISGIDDLDTKYNSIRDRLCTINCTFFERLFESIFVKYNGLLEEQSAISKVDSTFIGISTSLLKWGMKNGQSDKKRFIKMTISLKGSLPSSAQLYTEQEFVNENIALGDAILKNNHLNDSIVTFDRGLQTRKKFVDFTDKNIVFVARIKTDTAYKTVEERVILKSENDRIRITQDIEINLKMNGAFRKYARFRLVKGIMKKNEKPIHFITNNFDLEPIEIAEIYRQRWDIEVFFRYLKQNLDLTHIVSRNENAIKVMLYMTLILSMLIIVYKKKNKIDSYKIAKLKFEIELENFIMKEVVVLCGGDPNKASHLFNSS